MSIDTYNCKLTVWDATTTGSEEIHDRTINFLKAFDVRKYSVEKIETDEKLSFLFIIEAEFKLESPYAVNHFMTAITAYAVFTQSYLHEDRLF